MKTAKLIWTLCLLLALSACKQQVDYTTVDIQDPVRHYYPIQQGQELLVAVRLTNSGKVPLIIKDVQPSCGCIVMDGSKTLMVPPGRFVYVTLRYDSRKNVGKVDHAIRFWGNIAPDGMAEMRFDVNVVPEAGVHKDYEQLVGQDRSLGTTLRDLVRGGSTDTGMGYYVDQ